MLKKIVPVIIAVAVFAVAWFLLQPEQTVKAVAVQTDLAAGQVLTANDLQWAQVPRSKLPADAITDPALAIGQSLKTDRSAGDVLRAAHLGQAVAALRPDERAIAVQVSDASGLAGLLKPGDPVGLTAVLFTSDGAYSKVTVEGLRVLYVSPDFRAGYAETQRNSDSALSANPQRSDSGPVVLAVPAAAQVVSYDFGDKTETQTVNALELLAALNAANNAKLSLYAMPADAVAFTTSGLFMPDLVLRPTPTPTPSETPVGFEPTPAGTPVAENTPLPKGH